MLITQLSYAYINIIKINFYKFKNKFLLLLSVSCCSKLFEERSVTYVINLLS